MSSNTNGFLNENELVSYLNNKKFCDLNDNMKSFVSFLFNRKIKENELILSGKHQKIENKNPKPDIWIKIGKKIKNVSIKIGNGNSVHQESLNGFCMFLKRIRVPDNIIKNLKLFHFGDTTIDGTGNNRFSNKDTSKIYKNEIEKANVVFNKKRFLVKIIDRLLFSGNFRNPIVVDAEYHGSINNGVWASRKEIIKYMKNSKFTNSDTIKFANLTYQPYMRDENRTAKKPKGRYDMQAKWGSMTNCIKTIASRRKKK